MGPGDLDEALCGVEIPYDPNVLAGIKGSEDAGVYRLNETSALVQTVDFFTPIVDDPRIFGRAAAANALSDVYAMGGRPLTALNIICFPVRRLGIAPAKEIILGGLDILREAGVALVGGHSVEDAEPKYGLAVTGLVHPDKIIVNSGLRPGYRLILTKAIGTGVVATALKGGLAPKTAVEAMVKSMCTLNREAADVAARFDVRAGTDVTGFGLAGHLAEMAKASSCRIRIDSAAVPILDGAREAAAHGMVPGGTRANQKFFGGITTIDSDIAPETVDLMFDPQTSGGLILALPQERVKALLAALVAEGVAIAAEIGEVLENHDSGHVLIQ